MFEFGGQQESSAAWAFVVQQLGVPIMIWVLWLLIPVGGNGPWALSESLWGVVLAVLANRTFRSWVSVGKWIWVAPTLLFFSDASHWIGQRGLSWWWGQMASGEDPVGVLLFVPTLGTELYSLTLVFLDLWMVHGDVERT